MTRMFKREKVFPLLTLSADCSGAYETDIMERFWLMSDSFLQLEYAVELIRASLRSENSPTLYTVEQVIMTKTIVYDYFRVEASIERGFD